MRLSRASFALLGAVLLILTGCVSAVGVEGAAREGGVPADFGVAIYVPSGVIGGEAWAEVGDPGARAAQTEPSSDALAQAGTLMLEPDGTLRVGRGVDEPGGPLPPIVRTLTREQCAEVFRDLEAGGVFAVEGGYAGLAVGDAHAESLRQRLVGVAWSAGSRRRALLVGPQVEGDAGSAWPAVERVIGTLREWGWGAEGTGQ